MQFVKTILVMLILGACASVQVQGVKGQVFWLSGNQMPGPDKKRSPQQGIVREILFYEATKISETKQEDNFFTITGKSPVGSVISQSNGDFSISLPPGKYSVFIKEEGKLFANLFDGDGCINCITVEPKNFTWLTITVDYAAAY